MEWIQVAQKEVKWRSRMNMGTELRQRSRRGILVLKDCAMQIYLHAETKENSRIYPSSQNKFSWNFTVACYLLRLSYEQTPLRSLINFICTCRAEIIEISSKRKKYLTALFPILVTNADRFIKLICVEKVSILSPLTKHLKNNLNSKFWSHPVLRRRVWTLVSYWIYFVINGFLNVFLCRNCVFVWQIWRWLWT
jgi:hypothetical protein